MTTNRCFNDIYLERNVQHVPYKIQSVVIAYLSGKKDVLIFSNFPFWFASVYLIAASFLIAAWSKQRNSDFLRSKSLNETQAFDRTAIHKMSRSQVSGFFCCYIAQTRSETRSETRDTVAFQRMLITNSDVTTHLSHSLTLTLGQWGCSEAMTQHFSHLFRRCRTCPVFPLARSQPPSHAPFVPHECLFILNYVYIYVITNKIRNTKWHISH